MIDMPDLDVEEDTICSYTALQKGDRFKHPITGRWLYVLSHCTYSPAMYVNTDKDFEGAWRCFYQSLHGHKLPIKRYGTITQPVRTGPIELPCQVCSKMNDVGVNSCYMCGNKPHR